MAITFSAILIERDCSACRTSAPVPTALNKTFVIVVSFKLEERRNVCEKHVLVLDQHLHESYAIVEP